MAGISTAHSPQLPGFSRNRFQQALVAVYALVWIWSAINPVNFRDWLLENILVVAGVAWATWLCRLRVVSDTSAICGALFIILHSVGAHYTYSLVPLGDWIKEAAGLDRNHYDRVIHLSFGLLLTYPIREAFFRRGIVTWGWAGFLAFTVVVTCSGVYELMEWAAAVIVDPESGQAFLGTQGDPFDSQKDQLMALIGSLVTLTLNRFTARR